MWCIGITGKFSVTSRSSAPPLLQVLVSPSQASAKSESNAGDGTTSAAVLTQALTFSCCWLLLVRENMVYPCLSCIDFHFFNWTYSISEVLGQPPTIARLQDPSDPSFFAEKKRLDLEIWPRTAGDGQWGAQRWPQLSKPVNQILTGFVTAVIYGYNGYSYSDIYLLYIIFINVNH